MSYETVALGDIANDLTVGHVGSMANEYLPDGVPFLRSLNIQPYRINTNEIRYVSSAFHKKLKKSALKPGDVVIVRTGKPGTCAVIPEWLEEANCSDLVIVRCAEAIRPRYLAYWVNSIATHHIDSSLVGAVQQHFNVGAARKMPVLLPTLPEQDAILEVLASLDDKIELNRRMNERLEEMARALFRDWFVDFGPTRRQIEGATDPAAIMGHAFPPEKAATVASLFPAKLGDDSLPEGWETRDLRSALTLNYGKSLTKKARKPGPFNVFGSGGISGTHDTALAKGPSIVVGRKGTVGSLYWTSEDFYAIDTVFYVTSEYPMVYCHRLLETLGLETMNTDAAVPGLNRDNAYRQEFAFGGDALIDAFAEFVETLTTKTDANLQENQTLAEMRDLLLPKLMSGEIRLKVAEAAV